MFKKLYNKINDVERACKNQVYNECSVIRKMLADMRDSNKANNMSQLNRMEGIIESQQRTIEQLTNALKDKYEHGLFIFSEDCKIPMVVRNGKELTNDLTSCFSIEWVHGEAPNITIEQFAGTVADSEV